MEKQDKPTPVEALLRQEWEADAIKNVGNRLMADIVADARRGISPSASMIPNRQRDDEPVRAPSGGMAPLPNWGARSKYWAPTPDEERRAAQIAEQQRLELAAIEAKLEGGKPSTSDYHPLQKFDREMPATHRDDE